MSFCYTIQLVYSFELECYQLPIKCFDLHLIPEGGGMGGRLCMFYWILMTPESQMARKSRLQLFTILAFKSE